MSDHPTDLDAAAGAAFASALHEPEPDRVRWQYHTLIVPMDARHFAETLPQLDRLGAEGWEAWGILPGSNRTYVLLKRPS